MVEKGVCFAVDEVQEPGLAVRDSKYFNVSGVAVEYVLIFTKLLLIRGATL